MRTAQGRWTDIFLAFRLALDPRKLWLAFRALVLSLVLVGLLLALVAWVYPASGVELAAYPPRLTSVVLLAGADLILILVWAYYAAALMRLMAVEYALGERIEVASALAWARRKYASFCGSILILGAMAALLCVGIAFVGLIAANVLAAGVLVAGIVAAGFAAAVCSAKMRSGWAGLAVGAVGVVASVAAAVLLARAGVRIPYVGEVLAGLLSPLAFLAGLLVVILLLWMLFGSPLMFGTLSSSDGDVFEAWSRSFHYLLARPWLFLFLGLMFAVYAAACMGFVLALRVGAEWAVLSSLSAGLLGQYEVSLGWFGHIVKNPVTGSAKVLDFFLGANRLLLNLIVLSFWATFKCAAMTILYFVMRKAVDGTPATEVHLEPRDRELINPPRAAEQG